MTKLNYGKRYNSGAFGMRVGYNETDDRVNRQNAAMLKALSQRPLYKRELAAHKAGVSTRATNTDRSIDDTIVIENCL